MKLRSLFLGLGSLSLVLTAGVGPSSVCDRYQQADLIFTGSTETSWITTVDTRKSPIHKRSEKSKRVRFLVREWYKGPRHNTVEVWMTPGECTFVAAANQTYLVYARNNKDDGRTESDGCMGTVAVENAAADLRFLTAAQAGLGQATHLSGNAGGPGVNVLAQSGINKRYAVSDAGGQYVLDGLAAGDWQLSIVGGTPRPVSLAAGGCLVVDLAGK